MGTRLAVVLYALHLQASPAVVGILAALFSIVSIFVSVPMGRIMDRVGPGRPMMWCSLAMFLGCLAGFFWADIRALFVVSVVVGTAYSLFFVGHTQWVGRIGKPQDRVRNVSWAALGFSFATFLGPLATGYVIDHAGHAEALLAMGVVTLYPAVIILARVIVSPSGTLATPAARAAAGKRKLSDLLRHRPLRRVYAVGMVASCTWSLMSLMVPLYGAEQGLSASTIGMILAVYSLAGVVVRVFMVQIARRLSSWQQMLMSLGSAGLCFIVFPLLGNVSALMVVAFLIGIGMGLAGPLSQNLLYDASPPDRIGEVMGLRVTVMNATSTVVPTISGAVSAAFGALPIFWALAALLLGVSWLRREQWHERSPHERPGPPA